MKGFGFSVFEGGFVVFALRDLAGSLTEQLQEHAPPSARRAQASLHALDVPLVAERFQYPQAVGRASVHPDRPGLRAGAPQVPQPLLLQQQEPISSRSK